MSENIKNWKGKKKISSLKKKQGLISESLKN